MLGVSLGTTQVCGVVNRRTKKGSRLGAPTTERLPDPTSVSESSRNSSRMASARRMEAEQAENELIIRAEAEKRELNRQRAKMELEAQLKEEELNDKLAVAQGLTKLAEREEEEERSLDAESNYVLST